MVGWLVIVWSQSFDDDNSNSLVALQLLPATNQMHWCDSCAACIRSCFTIASGLPAMRCLPADSVSFRWKHRLRMRGRICIVNICIFTSIWIFGKRILVFFIVYYARFIWHDGNTNCNSGDSADHDHFECLLIDCDLNSSFAGKIRICCLNNDINMHVIRSFTHEKLIIDVNWCMFN